MPTHWRTAWVGPAAPGGGISRETEIDLHKKICRKLDLDPDKTGIMALERVLKARNDSILLLSSSTHQPGPEKP